MTEVAAPRAPLTLRAGPLSLLFEPHTGYLRYLKLGEVEVLRAVYAAVRDPNWGTVPPVISALELEARPTAFRLRFTAEHVQGDIGFTWQGEVEGKEDGTVRFSFAGVARSTFRRNRIGFCVLHPAACAGQPCTVGGVDGERKEGTFPHLIAPHQPFKDLRAITHEPLPGVRARVKMEGDTFEMEDQRNWTDASFKTYCTPLERPFPVEVPAGTRIQQAVTLSLEGTPPQTVPGEAPGLSLTVQGARRYALPKLGLGAASHGRPLSEGELGRLQALNLSHVRVDVHLAPNYEGAFKRRVDEARRLGVGLELALFLTDDAERELEAFRRLLDELQPNVAAWLIFHEHEKSTSERWVTLARHVLGDYAPDAKLGAGTNAFFAELNRERPSFPLDVVCYSANPQVHASDDASVVETLEALGSTVESARGFAPEAAVAVTPITLKPRFNPNATEPEPEPEPGKLPPQVDPRQRSLFAAGWTLGSLARFAEAGVCSLTYFETTGWRGVMETEGGSNLPDSFPSTPGELYPLYHVFRAVADFAGGEVLPVTPSHPLLVTGLALTGGDRRRLLVANLSGEERELRLEATLLGPRIGLKRLHEENAAGAARSPDFWNEVSAEPLDGENGTFHLSLPPYAALCLEPEGAGCG